MRRHFIIRRTTPGPHGPARNSSQGMLHGGSGFHPIKRRGQDRRRSWPSRAGGHDAPGPVSRPYRSPRLSDRRYATDRDLTREMPLVVPRDQRNHFLPPVMTTVFPSGFGERGFRFQPRHLEYRLYGLAILVNPLCSACVPTFANCQNQDLRDFMIRQDWEISIAERFQS